ncbi:MAG: NAD-dependent protein deacylase [Candidatus Eisenbacteria bacterium]|uniref:NAD-dependent protein deacylase n=1 Tax=Eiseniibacteriota bacterium TaxID=2212470 RepID=A0A933SA09_UNCEI|nr:NAD-dependent protein deacylase [Candidatus Eisenbacteria bacterium]
MSTLELVRGWLRDAHRIVALTGAGISAESGIPTFRGAGGLWREFRAEDLATPHAFARDPKLVWEWYDWRRGLVAAARPNAAHAALAARPDITLVTQNVDGLHTLAGSRGVLEVHGDLWTLRCVGCGAERSDRTVPLPELPPRCSVCGDLLRPGVVWFGESLPERTWSLASAAAEAADVFLVIGTSSLVHPAAGLAARAKAAANAKVVEVNLERSGAGADAFLEGRAGEVLPALLAGG